MEGQTKISIRIGHSVVDSILYDNEASARLQEDCGVADIRMSDYGIPPPMSSSGSLTMPTTLWADRLNPTAVSSASTTA